MNNAKTHWTNTSDLIEEYISAKYELESMWIGIGFVSVSFCFMHMYSCHGHIRLVWIRKTHNMYLETYINSRKKEKHPWQTSRIEMYRILVLSTLHAIIIRPCLIAAWFIMGVWWLLVFMLIIRQTIQAIWYSVSAVSRSQAALRFSSSQRATSRNCQRALVKEECVSPICGVAKKC